MNSIQNNGGNDRSLKRELDELGQAYGNLEQDEPPELLDMAILNSAHRAVEKRPHWIKFSWVHGLTTTAVFVLALGIVLHQRQPVSDFESGIDSDKAIQYQEFRVESPAAEKASGKQGDGFSDMRAKDDSSIDTLETAPAPTERIQKVENKGAQRRERATQIPLEPTTQDDPQAATATTEKGRTKTEPMAEDVLIEKHSEADTAQISAVATSIAAEAEMELRDKTQRQLVAEEELAAIIRLKQSGDESWKSELEAFRNNYPDYPLPDELRIP